MRGPCATASGVMAGQLDRFCHRVTSGAPEACEGLSMEVEPRLLSARQDVESLLRAPRCLGCGLTIVVTCVAEEVSDADDLPQSTVGAGLVAVGFVASGRSPSGGEIFVHAPTGIMLVLAADGTADVVCTEPMTHVVKWRATFMPGLGQDKLVRAMTEMIAANWPKSRKTSGAN